MREILLPSKKVCLLRGLGKHSPFWFQSFTAETVTISIMIYFEKMTIIFRIKLTLFQNRFTTYGSPVLVMREIEARFDWPWKGYLMWPPTVPTFCWLIDPCLAENHSWEHEVCIRKIKTKKYWKIPEIYPVKPKKEKT